MALEYINDPVTRSIAKDEIAKNDAIKAASAPETNPQQGASSKATHTNLPSDPEQREKAISAAEKEQKYFEEKRREWDAVPGGFSQWNFMTSNPDAGINTSRIGAYQAATGAQEKAHAQAGAARDTANAIRNAQMADRYLDEALEQGRLVRQLQVAQNDAKDEKTKRDIRDRAILAKEKQAEALHRAYRVSPSYTNAALAELNKTVNTPAGTITTHPVTGLPSAQGGIPYSDIPLHQKAEADTNRKIPGPQAPQAPFPFGDPAKANTPAPSGGVQAVNTGLSGGATAAPSVGNTSPGIKPAPAIPAPVTPAPSAGAAAPAAGKPAAGKPGVAAPSSGAPAPAAAPSSGAPAPAAAPKPPGGATAPEFVQGTRIVPPPKGKHGIPDVHPSDPSYNFTDVKGSTEGADVRTSFGAHNALEANKKARDERAAELKVLRARNDTASTVEHNASIILKIAQQKPEIFGLFSDTSLLANIVSIVDNGHATFGSGQGESNLRVAFRDADEKARQIFSKPEDLKAYQEVKQATINLLSSRAKTFGYNPTDYENRLNLSTLPSALVNPNTAKRMALALQYEASYDRKVFDSFNHFSNVKQTVGGTPANYYDSSRYKFYRGELDKARKYILENMEDEIKASMAKGKK